MYAIELLGTLIYFILLVWELRLAIINYVTGNPKAQLTSNRPIIVHGPYR